MERPLLWEVVKHGEERGWTVDEHDQDTCRKDTRGAWTLCGAGSLLARKPPKM